MLLSGSMANGESGDGIGLRAASLLAAWSGLFSCEMRGMMALGG